VRRALDRGRGRGGRGVVVKDWDSTSYKRKHLRWIKMTQEHQQYAAREEKRKDEVLGVFRGLVKLSSSKQHLEPHRSLYLHLR
jgi:hypothetical protein